MFVRRRPPRADCRSVRNVAAGLELANHTLPHNRVMGPVAYGLAFCATAAETVDPVLVLSNR